MEKRSLAEIARELVWPPNVDLPASVIDSALTEAGFDISDENERGRFRNLVAANYHHQATDELGDYLTSAREKAGPDAPDNEVYGIAWNMKENAEQWRKERKNYYR